MGPQESSPLPETPALAAVAFAAPLLCIVRKLSGGGLMGPGDG